jgi:hypothetical protein
VVLHPITAPAAARPAAHTVTAAWDAVSRTQKQPASAWWLIAQADHAALAGDLAANVSSPLFPEPDSEIVEAIALHDAGWTQIEGLPSPEAKIFSRGASRVFPVSGAGRPLSFLDINPADLLLAWNGSIERAARSSAIGGILVSHHFSRIAKARLNTVTDSGEDIKKLKHFLDREQDRQRDLATGTQRSAEEIQTLVDLLQFFDLLSLYLCCGTEQPVEFPQKFLGQSIRVRREDEIYIATPSIFGPGVSLGVTARPYPPSHDPSHAVTIPLLLS